MRDPVTKSSISEKMEISKLLAILSLAFLPFMITYLTTLLHVVITYKKVKPRGSPPTAPYWIPWIGHAWSFVLSPTTLAESLRKNFGQKIVCLKFFNVEVNMISGFDAINAVWKAKCLDSKPGVCISMDRFFGSSKTALQFYNADDSGIGLHPYPNSNVEEAYRIHYFTHKVTKGFMSGPGLKTLTNRFQALLKLQISETAIDENWTERPDFFSFIRNMVTIAAITSMCGPSLLELNPNFIEDLSEFDRTLPYFFKGYPSWLAPNAWKRRKRCLESVKRWHNFAKSRFSESCIEADGHDPYFGAPLIRSRQQYFSEMPMLSDDDIASENLGLIWAENANSVPATAWFLLEVMRNADLLRRVRDEAKASLCTLPSNEAHFDVDKLSGKPLLQSMFAETLRLRTMQFIVRSSDHEDFDCTGWKIPKGRLVAVDTYAAHTNKEIWSTGGVGNPHPVDKFWAERFLIYSSDQDSGPLKHKDQYDSSGVDLESTGEGKGPKFSLGGLSGAWIPFGGGRRQCPGREFAKQEIIIGVAILCSAFDIELMTDVEPEPDMDFYGLGGVRPKGKLPFKVRRCSEYRGT